ncbi:glycosyltransferase 87 family protein [Teichococcus aestuarii]|uniref:glycosyltransferase 87 family protein n=1 Tax=Teichococcus aestuarii TaxID=568898 RepID=UPI00360627A7
MALIPIDLRTDRWFLLGLALRIAAIVLLVPEVQAHWFTPFMAQTLAAPSLDPWTSFLLQDGRTPDFFYGPVMYLYHAPFLLPGMLADRLAESGTIFTGMAMGVSLLVADLALLLVLRRMNEGHDERVLLFYWLSPLVLFITYWHGDTDLVPTLLLALSLLLLQRNSPVWAGVVLGLGIGAKVSILAVVPFLVIFLWSHRRHRDTLPGFLLACMGVALLLLVPPLLFSPAVQQMLASNPRLLVANPGMVSILDVDIVLGAGQKLYIMPVVYLLGLYGAWKVGRMSFDLLYTVLGVAYLVVLLLTPSAVGWYLWIIPFLVTFQLRAGPRASGLVMAFTVVLIAAKSLITAAPAVPLLGLPLGWLSLLPEDMMSALRLNSIMVSVLMGLGIVLALTMLRRGLDENDFFGLSQRPLAIGIAGDSGTGKDTLALAMAGLFGEGAVTGISGDDYHLFERRGKLWQAFTHLDPRANDLEAFTRDALSLLAWRPIMCRHYDHATGLFTPPRRIQASDVAMVTGLHALYPPALRECLDVGLYLDMDEGLRRFFKIRRDVGQRGHSLERVLASIERRMPDYEAFIRPQREHADVVFSLMPADPVLLEDINYTGPMPLKLRVRMRSAISLDRLARLLIALCGAQVDVTQAGANTMAELVIDGSDVQPEDIHFTALQLVPHLEELLARHPVWQPGMTGIMQLIVLLQLAELTPKRR